MQGNFRLLRLAVHFSALMIMVCAMVVGALGGATPRAALAQDDESEANKELVAMLYEEVVNNRNYEVVLEYVAPGLIEHRSEGDVTYETPEDFLAATQEDMESVPPDAQTTINYQLADGDSVVSNFTMTFADSGVSANGFSVFRIQDGKVVEIEEIIDLAAMFEQFEAMNGGESAEEGGEAMTAAEVVAEGLNGPMGVLLDDDGNLWVVDSGVGGDEEVAIPDPESGEEMVATFGDTARIVMVAPDGTQTDVAVLPSVLQGGEGSGGNRLAILDGVLYVTSGGWFEGIPLDRMPLMAAIGAVGEDGTVEEVANTWDIEVDENPDGFVVESHPYGLAAGPDGLLWVADAGANTVYTVDPASGEVTLVAVIDGVESPMPNPTRGDAMEMDPVPTGIVAAEDGGAYVALLPGFPFLPGSSKVVYVSPEGEVSDYATGLTMITDLRMAADGELYGVQLGEFTEQGPTPNSGAIWHIHEGEGSEIVFAGLSFPTSIDFNEAGDAYISVNGVGEPGSGEVLLIPALTEMSAAEAHEEAPEGDSGTMEPLPLPEAAMGPEIPQDKGYLVEEIGRGLYWLTDGSYQTIFLTTGEGVIVVDAPPNLGEKILAAIAEVTDEPITHVIYSHAHADHIAAAGLYPPDATYIAQAETAADLADRGADDPSLALPFGLFVGGAPVPLPTETFDDAMTLEVGDQVLELTYEGANHQHGNTFIYAPEQKVLTVVDVVFPGWSPFRQIAVSEDVPGFLAAHESILEYDFDIYVGGHLGRYGTREDVETQKAYMEAMVENAYTALQTTDFMAIAAETGFENPWLLYNTYLETAAQACADLTIEEWGDVLGGVDLNTVSHCDRIITALRVD